MPLRSAAEIEALKQKLPLLPLHKLRVKELQAAAFGLVGIRGKLKSVVVESIRKYLAAAPVEDGLMPEQFFTLNPEFLTDTEKWSYRDLQVG